MPAYEYRIVPAPRVATKEKGAKTTEARFAVTLTRLMNELGAEGWEYLRAETLPCDERRGFTGRVETTQHVLVFRRERVAPVAPAAVPSVRVPAPAPAAPGTSPVLGSANPPPRTDTVPRLVLNPNRRD
jgi:hypothetical protein